MLSRRAALKGGGAAACVLGVVAPVAAIEVEDEAVQIAADWCAAWSRLFDYARLIYQQNEQSDSHFNEWFVQSGGPKLQDDYLRAEKCLLTCEPVTVPGATAVLGCATEVLKARRLATEPREGIYAGLVVRMFITYPELRMIDIGHKTLVRFVGEG